MGVNGGYEGSPSYWLDFELLNNLPLFPYRMQILSFMGRENELACSASVCTTWDHSYKVFAGWTEGNPLLPIKASSPNLFDYSGQWSRCIGLEDFLDTYLGLVPETVWTMSADWLSFRQYKPDWEPQTPTKPFAFAVYSNWSHRHRGIERLHWICIHELQKHLARTATENYNLPSNGAIIMLLIIGLPVLEFTPCEGDSEVHVSPWKFVIGEFHRFWHHNTFQLWFDWIRRRGVFYDIEKRRKWSWLYVAGLGRHSDGILVRARIRRRWWWIGPKAEDCPCRPTGTARRNVPVTWVQQKFNSSRSIADLFEVGCIWCPNLQILNRLVVGSGRYRPGWVLHRK